ncbi:MULTISPECIES: hypothetical protein [unclassified Streptomyces]|uniref:hypothetical protein n=1 Tax=unclassified Streptomyces TaxID=2593676 RepID=UPI002DD91B57|nr:hypothetical protein [Streptomyces sp. NBC_01763]WSC35590.1 hypothetical protein OHA08_08815 [Streptomyces sp. NBC_01763]WSF88201.1 hypothetical protein OIE70_36835 [Streptomyces sp. NBC_01744]
MFARDLAEPYPSVSTNDRAADTARLLAGQLPALLVPDMDQRPYAMVTGSQFLKQPAPDYVLEAPHVAAVIDDRHLAEVTEDIAGRTVSEWLPPRTYTRLDAGALQVAADRWSLSSSATGTKSGWWAPSPPPA